MIFLKNILAQSYENCFNYFKILINGDWMGFTTDIKSFHSKLVTMKLQNKINRYTGICLDIENKELRVYTDGGRLIRPLLTVNPETYELNLTDKMISEIDVSGLDPKKITSWEQFISKYQDIVEYIDVEQSAYVLIAMYRKNLEKTIAARQNLAR